MSFCTFFKIFQTPEYMQQTCTISVSIEEIKANVCLTEWSVWYC